MVSPTNQEMLDAVNTAIYAILNGGAVQSYSIGGRNIQKASLNELYTLRRKLEADIAAGNGSGRTYAKFMNADD